MTDEHKKWNKVLIHIGLPRCASTYLQEVFFPSLPVDIFNNWGCDKEKLSNEVFKSVKSDNFDESYFTKWISGKINKKNDTLVISQESLGWGDAETTNITANNLYKSFPDAEILIIIREQFSFITSNYCYKVTTGCFHETKNLGEYIDFLYEINFFDQLEYDKLIRYYQNLFGKDKVYVLPVEMLKNEHGLFNSSLLDIFGIESDFFSKKNKKLVNRSYKSQSVINKMLLLNRLFNFFYVGFRKMNLSLYWENKFIYAYYHSKSLIARVLGKFFEKDSLPPVELSNAQKLELRQRFAKSNSALKEIVNIPLEDYGYILD